MIGIRNGMVMQRNAENFCEIHLRDIKTVSTAFYRGKKSGAICISPEPQGAVLSGIPTGGPYTVTVNEETFENIYVGDVWILAGQSNMEGAGWLTPEDIAFQGAADVRAFYMNDEWAPARHRLHRLWQAVDKVHITGVPMNPGKEPERRGVGPGLAFAMRMREITGVPQGIICCAHGGTTLEQWSPDLFDLGTDKSLFAATIRRFIANGSHIRGLFWYQGCSEAMSCAAENFDTKTAKVFSGFRDFFGAVPILQVQIGNTVLKTTTDFASDWMHVRAQQLAMNQSIRQLDTISAVGYETDDLIHLSSDAQRQLGIAAANTMAAMTEGLPYLPAPRLEAVRCYEEWVDDFYAIDISFKNIYGNLQSPGRPSGFSFSLCDDHITHDGICHITLRENHVIIRTFIAQKPSNLYLFYGFGLNPYCNITDGFGRRLPAFGPIRICL